MSNSIDVAEGEDLQSSGYSTNLQVIRHLQVTRFAAIKVCRDLSTQSFVVVKESLMQQSRYQMTDSIGHERTIANHLLMASRPHPHIVRFFHVANEYQDSSNGIHHHGKCHATLVMEHCQLGDLFAHLKRQPECAFSEEEALHYFGHIVRGVHHLHSLGYAHRDISLENVLLSDDGNAKICDFGLSVTIKRCFDTVGKAQYMAPEVTAGGGYEPVAADMWSLGIVLFIMLTGSPLFELAEPSDAAWTAIQRIGVSGILKRWGLETISRNTVDLMEMLLKLDSRQRPQSLASVLQVL